jgi:hypothetical protein
LSVGRDWEGATMPKMGWMGFLIYEYDSERFEP